MEKINDGGSLVTFVDGQTMTLRDYFAGQALAGILMGNVIAYDNPNKAAQWSYQTADAMLRARKANNGE